MNCLKCGRETDQTFCEECRDVMQQYPVKPGTVIMLPKDRSAAYRRASRRQAAVTPEMQIESQQKTIRRLRRVVLVMTLLLIASAVAIGFLFRSSGTRPVGQNYSTVTKPVDMQTGAVG